MEEHPVMEREHTRVNEENKTEAGEVRRVRQVRQVRRVRQVRQVRPDGLDDVGGPVGRRWG